MLRFNLKTVYYHADEYLSISNTSTFNIIMILTLNVNINKSRILKEH